MRVAFRVEKLGHQRLYWFILLFSCFFTLGMFRAPFLYSSHAYRKTIFQIANLNSKGSSIICLGDSLTQGIGASPNHDFPNLLSKKLGVPIINAGVDGDETGDALNRLESDVLAKDPKLVIVELGANDFMDGQSLQKTFKNLDEIVRRIEVQGAMVVVVGIPPGFLGDTLQRDYNRIIQKYHAAFVPKVLEGILSNPRLQSADNLHPNDAGYALIAQRIQEVVTPLVKQDGADNG